MNPISVAIIFVIFLTYVVFQVVKQLMLGSVTKAIKTKDYELVIQLTTMPLVITFLGKYTCDVYLAKAYYYLKDEGNFDVVVNKILQSKYKEEDKKTFITSYYHIFLMKENKKYVTLFLEEINKSGDENFIKYSNQAYEVIMNKRSDLIQVMDKQIDSKQFYGFPLGVILFMIAMQYTYIDDKENAVLYFENAKVCFPPNEKYLSLCDKQIQMLG